MYFYTLFQTLQSLIKLQFTDNRKESLAGKRQEKRDQSSITMPALTSQIAPIWVGPPAPAQSEEEVRRIISISDPSKSSAGSKFLQACQEMETQMLGNVFCTVAINALFEKDATIDWVIGRDQSPVVQWRSR